MSLKVQSHVQCLVQALMSLMAQGARFLFSYRCLCRHGSQRAAAAREQPEGSGRAMRERQPEGCGQLECSQRAARGQSAGSWREAIGQPKVISQRAAAARGQSEACGSQESFLAARWQPEGELQARGQGAAAGKPEASQRAGRCCCRGVRGSFACACMRGFVLVSH